MQLRFEETAPVNDSTRAISSARLIYSLKGLIAKKENIYSTISKMNKYIAMSLSLQQDGIQHILKKITDDNSRDIYLIIDFSIYKFICLYWSTLECLTNRLLDCNEWIN